MALMSDANWNLQVVTRKFVDISPGMEFRGFVFKRRLTAISQYDSTIFINTILDNKEIIQKNIQVRNTLILNQYHNKRLRYILMHPKELLIFNFRIFSIGHHRGFHMNHI